jgi:phage-related protein
MSCGSPTRLKTEWRVIYCVGRSAIGILEVFQKTSARTPVAVIQRCKKRFSAFDAQDAS